MTLLERLAAYGLKAMHSPDKARADALQAENDALSRLVSELKRALSSNRAEADSLRETLQRFKGASDKLSIDSERFARLAIPMRMVVENLGVTIEGSDNLALAQAMNRAYGVATQRLKAALEESGGRGPFEGSVFDAAINALRNVENARAQAFEREDKARAELKKERLTHSITLQAAEKWYKTGVSQGNPSLTREIEAKRKADYEAAGLPYVAFKED